MGGNGEQTTHPMTLVCPPHPSLPELRIVGQVTQLHLVQVMERIKICEKMKEVSLVDNIYLGQLYVFKRQVEDALVVPAHFLELVKVVQELKKELVTSAKRFDALDDKLKYHFDRVYERFNDIDQRFNDVDQRFNDVDECLKSIDDKFTDVDQQCAELNSKLDRLHHPLYLRNTLMDDGIRYLDPVQGAPALPANLPQNRENFKRMTDRLCDQLAASYEIQFDPNASLPEKIRRVGYHLGLIF